MEEKKQNKDKDQSSNSEVEIEYITPKKREKESEAAPKEKTVHPEEGIRKKDTEIRKLKKECKELKESYLRELAEKENLRKRLEKEKTDFYQYALSECLTELLSVLDNFERALESPQEGDERNFQEGVRMIYRQLQDVISKQGVKPIDIKEGVFDPQFQQALLTEESEDVSEVEVAEELQRGYTLHERLLRPALVKVRVPKKVN